MTSKLKQAISIHQKGNKIEAKKLYQEILENDPENATALHYSGLIAADNNETDLAKACIEKALLINPKNPHFHHNSAGMYSRIGLIDKASIHFQQAYKLKPDYAEAYQGYTESVFCDGEKQLLKQIESLLQTKSVSEKQKSYLHFAAGKICADSKYYKEAFQHYKKGNLYKNVTFDSEKNKQQTSLLMEYFNHEFVHNTKECGLYSRVPIFIVGMPRSGTTLVEQVLSSHSDMYGAGELPDIRNMINAISIKLKTKSDFPLLLNETNLLDLLGFGLSYLQHLNNLSGNMFRVINKTPINFKYIGFILLLFPNAKIIHMQRNPLDTCLSCYFQNFTNGQEFSFDLDKLGEFYIDYHDLMNHWCSIYPSKIKTVVYEHLVTRPEQEIRDLIDFCALPWEEQCLNFHKNNRSVTTASKYQIRKPLYQNSVGQWKNYKNDLQSLIAKLKEHGIEDDI